MRIALLLVAFVIIVGIVLVATRVVVLSQDSNGTVTVKTNDIQVGTKKVEVAVPTVGVTNSQ